MKKDIGFLRVLKICATISILLLSAFLGLMIGAKMYHVIEVKHFWVWIGLAISLLIICFGVGAYCVGNIPSKTDIDEQEVEK